MGQDHPSRSMRKGDRLIFYIVQISMMPFALKKRSCERYGFLYFAANTPPFLTGYVQ